MDKKWNSFGKVRAFFSSILTFAVFLPISNSALAEPFSLKYGMSEAETRAFVEIQPKEKFSKFIINELPASARLRSPPTCMHSHLRVDFTDEFIQFAANNSVDIKKLKRQELDLDEILKSKDRDDFLLSVENSFEGIVLHDFKHSGVNFSGACLSFVERELFAIHLIEYNKKIRNAIIEKYGKLNAVETNRSQQKIAYINNDPYPRIPDEYEQRLNRLEWKNKQNGKFYEKIIMTQWTLHDLTASARRPHNTITYQTMDNDKMMVKFHQINKLISNFREQIENDRLANEAAEAEEKKKLQDQF
jgi:hypothetical protein